MTEHDSKSLSEQESDIVYYYNRARRLENASQEVRSLHDGSATPPRGILRVLVSSKRNRYLFSSIVILCIVVIIRSFVLWASPSTGLGGALLEHKAFTYENSCYVDIQLNPQKDERCHAGSFLVTFDLLDKNEQVIESSVVSETCRDEGCRIKHKMDFPADAQWIRIIAEYNNDVVTLTESLDR